ncbi:MAG: Ig-like domain repeat protein, partial [Terracidiphilus sp.]
MSIRFSGTAAQVESAFHTEIHNLSVKGVAHIGNMSDPQIPAALAPAVVGVKALHNFFPHPLHHLGSQVTLSGTAGKWQRRPAAGSTAASSSPGAATRNTGLHPEFGVNVPASASTIPYQVEDVAPYDFATIYNILPLWTASTPIDGTGQTIAIAGTSNINPTDIASFRTFFGLPPNVPTVILGNGSDPGLCGTIGSSVNCGFGDLIENSLDVEWSGAIAKGANIVLVTSAQTSATDDPLYDSESYIVNHLTARIMNVSYGECELGQGTSGNVEYYNLWQTAAAEGIAVFVAAGDSGSASCDDGGDVNGVPYVAEYGLSVSGLASTPYNTSVGGTDFNWCPATTIYDAQIATSNPPECTPAPYWAATNGSVSAGRSSALGYVPEVPWNDTCSSPLALMYLEDWAENSTYFGVTGVKDAETACNFAAYYNDGSFNFYSLVDTVGGSGGASGCVVNTTDPTGTTFGTCSTGATSTGSVVGSIPLTSDGWQKPSWQINSNIPNLPADGVRDIPDVSFFASDGALSSSAYLVCVSEASIDPECTYSTSSEPTAFEVGGTSVASPAMAGVMALINQKTGAAQGSPNAELYALAGQQTYSDCSAEKVAAGTAPKTCFFNDIDSGTNAMPCDYGANLGISPNCTATESLRDPTGTYADNVGIQTGYSGGTGYDMATGLGSLNIANVVNAWPATIGSAKAAVTVTPAQNSVAASETLSVTVAVASSPAGGTTPTGTVTLLSGAYISAAESLTNGSVVITIPANSLSVGSDTLTASFNGDSIYSTAVNMATVTVTSAATLTPTVTVTPASSTVNSDASLNVQVTVSGGGGNPIPTGTVAISGGGYNSGAAQNQLDGTGSFTFTIPPNSLTAGTDTLTVTYSGDGNYIFASNTATVTVTESTFALAPVVTPSSIAPGASAAAAITISSVAGYAGAVTLTCQQQSGPASATDAPSCFVTSLSAGVNLSSSAPTGTVTFSVSTTEPHAAALVYPNAYPNQGGKGRGWAGAGGGAILALLVFLGVPARRRSWRAMLGVLLLMTALGSLTACGGGGSSTTTPPPTPDPGTTPGTYVFLVQGTGNPSVTPAVSTTFTVIVN